MHIRILNQLQLISKKVSSIEKLYKNQRKLILFLINYKNTLALPMIR